MLPSLQHGPLLQASALAEQIPPLRILIVEDNVDSAEMMGELLQALGHEVSVVDDGAKALDYLRTHSADLALCDLGLPGLSGYELAEAVRAEPNLRQLTLIALTGYGQETDRQRSLAAGFNAHLTKPVDLATLSQTLLKLLPTAR